MRFEKVKIAKLLPIEMQLNNPTLVRLLDNFNPERVDAISLVVLGDDYIINDGHHRSAVLHHLGIEEIYAGIMENDSDIANTDFGAILSINSDPKRFGLPEDFMPTVGKVIDVYERFYRPSCAKHGIRRIEDYNAGKKAEEYRKIISSLGRGVII